MRTHDQIDARSLRLAQAVAARIDADPAHRGLAHARHLCRTWQAREPLPVYAEWLHILEQPWPAVRAVLCEDSPRGRRLRQSNPFCGVLAPRERWTFYRETSPHEASRS